MTLTINGNPEKIKKICEWTKKEFIVDWKHRHQRFINKRAMYDWRKYQSHEIVKCLNCKKSFKRYKNYIHPRTKKPIQYCSVFCSKTSVEVCEKKRKWGLSEKNHWNKKECQDKVKKTKQERYGNPYYNNMEKNIKTCMTNYGVPYSVYLPQCISNGNRISKFQIKIYEQIKQKYKDAQLEVYLCDVKKSVDIFIPSIKKIIECYGDYWHCNPLKYKSNFYNKSVHLPAKEIWDRDKKRIDFLVKNGYDVEIFWENNTKKVKNNDI